MMRFVFMKLREAAIRLYRSQEAPTTVEYGLLVALIALIATVAVKGFGQGAATLLEVPPEYFN